MQLFLYLFYNYVAYNYLDVADLYCKSLCSLESLMKSSRKTALLAAKRVTLNLILKKTLVEEGDTF